MACLAGNLVSMVIEFGFGFMRLIAMTGNTGSRITIILTTTNQGTFIIRGRRRITTTGDFMRITQVAIPTGHIQPVFLHMNIEMTGWINQ